MHSYPPGHLGLKDFAELFVGPALVLVIAGWLLWRKKRPAQAYDLALWFSLSSLALTYMLLYAEPFFRSPSANDLQLAGWFFLPFLIAVPVGCVVTMIRIQRQKSGVRRALTYAAGPFLYASYLLLAPSLATPAEHVRRTMCKTKLRNLAWAIYDQANEQHQIPPTVAGDPPVSWRVRLLPRLDQVDLFHHYDKSVQWNVARNANLMTVEVDNYQCPADGYWRRRERSEGPFYTSYAAAVGPRALLSSRESSKLLDASDGLSNTILLLEVCGQGIVWSEPRDIDISQTPLGINLPGDAPGRSSGVLSSQHIDGAFAAMGDGSVLELGNHTDPNLLRQLLQRDDGKPVGDF